MAIVYLALGSNLGDRQAYIQKALSRLNANKITVLKLSSIIETDPVGGPEQGKYLNAVVQVETNLSPENLHRCTQLIETRLGRIRKVVNGPRVIDIDILLYDNIKLITKDLLIPHPRMFERSFVITPLKEIAPAVCASFAPFLN